MEKSKQENPINNYPPQELKKDWMEKLEMEHKEISQLYKALYNKTLEAFGEEEGKKRWKEIVAEYDKIQIESDKEKRDGLLKSFLRKKMQEEKSWMEKLDWMEKLEMEKLEMEKIEKENREISQLYNALDKTLEAFGKKEGKKRWKEIVAEYNKIQIESDKEKGDDFLKSFLREKIQESKGQQEEGPEAK